MAKPLVIITGASSGIGAATAQIFSAAGYPVGLIARNLEAMKKLNLPNSICQAIDVTNSNALKEAVKAAEEKFGPVDCMMNNAGYAKSGDFLKIDQADQENMVSVNIMGVINGITAVLPGMRARKKGTIINISSLADRSVRPHIATYAATKAAIKSLSESLRMDNAKYGIRVCNLAPGKILTPMLDTANISIEHAIDAKVFANIILWIYQQPQELCIRDMLLAPTYYEK